MSAIRAAGGGGGSVAPRRAPGKMGGVVDGRSAHRGKWIASRVTVYVVLGVGTVVMVLPLMWMIATSLSYSQFANTFPPKLIPTSLRFSNYVDVFTKDAVGTFLLNSVLIVVPSMIGNVLSSSLAGFALARLRAPGRRLWFILTLCTIMMPYEVTIIPTFILFRYFHWINTLYPIIVPQVIGSGYSIFLMRQFISSIPRELDEAAKLDGCGFFGIWRRVIVPLSVPSMVAVAIFNFTYQWGNFLGPLIYINEPSRYPLALGLYVMTQTSNVGQEPPWNTIMAGSMLLTVPMVMVYFFGQRFLYEGSNVLGRVRA